MIVDYKVSCHGLNAPRACGTCNACAKQSEGTAIEPEQVNWVCLDLVEWRDDE